MQYVFPENTDEVYHIALEYEGQMTFDRIFEKISDHFGEGCTLDQFKLEFKNIKTAVGCNCCETRSDYDPYLVVTLVKDEDRSKLVRPFSLGYMIDTPAQHD